MCGVEKEKYDDFVYLKAYTWGVNALDNVLAQSFTTQDTFTLCSVKVVLKDAWGGSNQSATLYVQDGPDSTSNVFTQVTRSGIGAPETWYTFDVPDIQLIQNGLYFIRVKGDVLYYKYEDQVRDPYTGGHAYEDGVKVDSVDADGDHHDHFFVTYTYGDFALTPAVTDWGLIALTLLLIAGGVALLLRRRERRA